MTDIQAPDGSIARFPDGMADADIEKVMQQQFPAPPAPAQDPGTASNFARGMRMALPFGDRIVAAEKTYLPNFLGGNDQGYAANLATEQARDQQLQTQHSVAGNLGQGTGAVLSAAPFSVIGAPAVAGLGERIGTGALQGAGIGSLQGASQTPDLGNLSQALSNTGAGAAAGGAVGGLAAGLTSFPARPAQPAGNQFTRDVLNQAGIPGSSVRPETLDAAKKSITSNMQDVAARNTMIPDQQLHQDIGNAAGGYNKLISPNQTVQNTADNLVSQVPLSGAVSGADYADLRSELTKKSYALKMSDPETASAYRGMRDALDSGMDRSISANNPGDTGLLQDARRSYGNYMDVAKAASKLKGADAAQGNLTPARMQAVLSSGSNAANYAAGQGNLAGITRDAVKNMAPSSTPGGLPEFVQQHLASALGRGVLGAATGGYEGGWKHAAAGAAAGAASKTLGSALSNNQLTQKIGAALNTSVTPLMLNLARALAAKQATGR